MDTYTVKDVSKHTGIPATTLRYWGKRGLLDFVGRNSAGVRTFTEEDFEALLIIQTLKDAGMALERIREFMSLYSEGNGTLSARLSMYREQLQLALERKAELERAIGILEYKCWYMEEALERGDAWFFKSLPEEEVPQRIKDFYEDVEGFMDA